MRFVAGVTMALVAMTNLAVATDLPSRKKTPDPSVITKRAQAFRTGFYIGASAAYGWNALQYTSGFIGSEPITSGSPKQSGAQFGMKFGHDLEFANGYLAGLVGEVSLSSIGKSTQCLTGPCDGYSGSARLPVLGSFRSRFGVLSGPNLFYFTSGLGFAQVQSELTNSSHSASSSRKEIRFAGTIGGGIEHQLSDNLSVEAEYLYYKFGDRLYNYTPDHVPAQLAIGDTMNQVKASLNYRF